MAETKTLGSSFVIGGDLRVNRMGFGTMRLTGEGIWGPPKDRDEAIRVLHKTQELDINFIDTADSYGPDVAEELVAEALHPYPEGLVIATKGGLTRTGPGQWPVNAHPDHLRRALEGSLKKLKVDRIDLYQLHRVDPEVPYEKTLEFLQSVQEEGLVKHIGLSEVSVDQIKKAQEYVQVVSIQNKYSVFHRRWEKVLEYCQSQGMAFIPWNPMAAGKQQYLAELEDIAKKYNASAFQIALVWLYQRSPNILLIPGTSKVKHLIENTKSVDIMISDEDLDELNRLATPED